MADYLELRMKRFRPLFGTRWSLFLSVTALLIAMGLQAALALPPGSKPYPLGPNPQTTPGSVCMRPTTYRYPERIKYCNRMVESSLKNEIIRDYDRQFGYNIGRMQRSQFKIDHYIPLCAGGSNERDNLWPQHQSVYKITDPLEPLVCDRMAKGRLKQAQAIEFIKAGKNNLARVPEILDRLQRL
jgi:hypothetical protein